MIPTERLYYQDSGLREFEARVVETAASSGGVKVYLDRTAFYPESGGQPSDRGVLGECTVLDVLDEGERVAHLLDAAPKEVLVHCRIDWERRLDHMQQHTGQHILSAALEKAAGYKTVSFHLGSEVSTIDLDSERVGLRQLEAAEELANRVVYENRPVRVFFRPAAEVGPLDLRKPTERQGDVRLVEVEGFDLSACGGTHVATTGSVGLVLIRRVERMKHETRLEFLSGRRALGAARRNFQTLSEAARLLSGSAEALPVLVSKHLEELRAARREHQKLEEELAEFQARALLEQAEMSKGHRIVRKIFEASEAGRAKKIAHVLTEVRFGEPGVTALIAIRGQPTGLIFAQAADGPADMNLLLREILRQFGGKGGGNRNFAQGGGLDATCLEKALNAAWELL